MPSVRKVRWAQLKVGIVVISALVILAVLVFLMTGDKGFFTTGAKIYTYLDDSAAITPGSPVRLNGILIGDISHIGLSGEEIPNRIIRVEMDVDAGMLSSIPVDSIAAVASENVLGTKYINIKRGISPTSVESGSEIASLDTREFDELVSSGYATLASLQGILGRVEEIVGQIEVGKGSIGKLLVDEELYDNLTGTVEEARKVTTALNSGEGTVGKLLYDDTLYEELRNSITRLNVIIEDVESGQGTLGMFIKDPSVYEEAKNTITELKQLVADLNAGKGTAGKLLTDDELHQQITSVVARLDTTLESINSGEGTLGQLVVNPQLFESLNGATAEMHELLKDFRTNPKKFLRIKLALF